MASHGPVGMHRILGKTQGFVVLLISVMVSRSLGKNASDISAYLYLFENVAICVSVYLYLYLLVFLKWTADLLRYACICICANKSADIVRYDYGNHGPGNH